MHKGSDFGTAGHRERGRGRLAFWFLVFVALAVGLILAL